MRTAISGWNYGKGRKAHGPEAGSARVEKGLVAAGHAAPKVVPCGSLKNAGSSSALISY